MLQPDAFSHASDEIKNGLALTEAEIRSVPEYRNLSASEIEELSFLIYHFSIALYHLHENEKQP